MIHLGLLSPCDKPSCYALGLGQAVESWCPWTLNTKKNTQTENPKRYALQLEQKPGTQPQESSRAFVLSSSCRDRTASRPTWHRLRRSSRNQGIPCCLRCDSEFVLKKAGPWPGAWDSAAGKAHSGTVSALGKVEIISSHLRLSGKVGLGILSRVLLQGAHGVQRKDRDQ